MFSILVALKVRQHKIFPSVRSPRLPTSRRTLGLPNPSPGSRGLQSSATHCPCGSVTAHLFGMISGDPCYLCPPCSMPGFWSHHHYHFEGYLWHVISWISKPDESDLEIVCPSFPSFLWIMQRKLVRPEAQRMSFYHEYQREKTCTVDFVLINGHTRSHWPAGAPMRIHLHIHCQGRQISLNNIGNATLGPKLVTKAAVSLPSDTISLGDQLLWKHRGKKDNLETESLFFPDISETECTPTWRYKKTLLFKVSLRPSLNDTGLGAMCAILSFLHDKPMRMNGQKNVTECVSGYLLKLWQMSPTIFLQIRQWKMNRISISLWGLLQMHYKAQRVFIRIQWVLGRMLVSGDGHKALPLTAVFNFFKIIISQDDKTKDMLILWADDTKLVWQVWYYNRWPKSLCKFISADLNTRSILTKPNFMSENNILI